MRCSTPEGKGSSPPSPVHIEEISLLSDKLQRYARAAETIIKKLGDREMEIVRLRAQNEVGELYNLSFLTSLASLHFPLGLCVNFRQLVKYRLLAQKVIQTLDLNS